jgi:predicted ATP-grasp superfamily ATP-dependent carboligase
MTGWLQPTPSKAHSGAERFDALILDASLRQSLVSVRSLGKRGLFVAALDAVDDLPAFSSRWCRKAFICPAEESAGYAAHLRELLDRTTVGVLLPSSDRTIAFLREHRDVLGRRARIAMASEAALAVAISKQQTLAIATRLGIRVPPTVPVETVDEVLFALKTIGLPAVVKPSESWVRGHGQGTRVVCAVVTTPEEALRAVASLTSLGATPLVQPLLSGRREAVSLLYANGRIHARFAQWAKRTAPPLGGESVLRQSIAIPRDIGEQAERLVREIGLEGYSEIEFRRDEAGTPYLMEINPRLSASVEVAVRSGVDFPYLMHQWARGGPIDVIDTYRVGGWMRHLRGDIMTTLAAVRHRGRPEVPSPIEAVVGFGTSFFRVMSYDYLDWSDPVPAVKAITAFVREIANVAFRRALQSTAS